MWIHRDEAVPSPPSRDSGPPILAMKPLISARFDQRLLHRQRALVGMWIPLWKSTLEHLSAWAAHTPCSTRQVVWTAPAGAPRYLNARSFAELGHTVQATPPKL
jgi:hypothetical protein